MSDLYFSVILQDSVIISFLFRIRLLRLDHRIIVAPLLCDQLRDPFLYFLVCLSILERNGCVEDQVRVGWSLHHPEIVDRDTRKFSGSSPRPLFRLVNLLVIDNDRVHMDHSFTAEFSL